jgi:hypothetical protein
MMRHIIRKDWKLLWPLVLLVALLQFLLGWLSFRWGFFGEDLAARALYPALGGAWYVGIVALIVAVVHQDAVPGISQDWLIRPLARRDLLCAKLLFIIATISVPMLIMDLVDANAAGFSLTESLGHTAFKEIYVLVTLLVPLLALASVTENWPQVLAGSVILLVLYSFCLIGASLAFGPGRCPTCGTGMKWIQSIIDHFAVLIGAVAILRLQYFRRRTLLSRGIIVVGVVLFALVQLPWAPAFAIEQRLSPDAPDAVSVDTSFDAAANAATMGPERSVPTAGAGRVARQLLNGNTDAAATYLNRRAHPENQPLAFELPLRITGVPKDAILIVDRSEVQLRSEDDRVLYDGVNPTDTAGLTIGSGDAPSHQTIELPAGLYRTWAQRPVHLQIRYWFTLFRKAQTYTMAATSGELTAGELGRCQSQLKGDLSEINLRCRQQGLGPTCYTVTLEAPDGKRDPGNPDCSPNYRPFTALWSAPMTFYGIDLQVHDPTGFVQYPIAPSLFADSRLLVTTYHARGHFVNTATTPPLRLANWNARPR